MAEHAKHAAFLAQPIAVKVEAVLHMFRQCRISSVWIALAAESRLIAFLGLRLAALGALDQIIQSLRLAALVTFLAGLRRGGIAGLGLAVGLRCRGRLLVGTAK